MPKRFLFILGALFFSLSACVDTDHPAERVVITVGDRTITTSELKKDIKTFIAEMEITDRKVSQVMNPLVEKIIDHYLLMEYARGKSIAVSENELELEIKDIKRGYDDKVFNNILLSRYIDYTEWKEELRQQLLIRKVNRMVSEDKISITFQEINTYFNAYPDEFKHPMMVKFSQVVTKTKKEAERVFARLKRGEDIGSLARECSITPEAKNDGDLGWFPKGKLETSMEKAVFALPTGKISPIVKTPYGYHIFQVTDRRAEGYQRLHEAIKQIEAKLVQKKKEVFYRKWCKKLRELYPVKIDKNILRTLEFG